MTKHPPTFLAFAAAFALTSACATSPIQAKTPRRKAPAKASNSPDVVLTAMGAELKRSTTALKLPEYDAPYYVAYAVKETRQANISGKNGSIYIDASNAKRLVYVDLRVGSYDFDSSEDPEGEWAGEGIYQPSTVGPLSSQKGLRHSFWLLTDLRYKQALSSYLKMKGQRVYEPEKKKRPSFSKAPAARRLDARVPLQYDKARWRTLVKALGAELATEPKIFDAEVEVDFRVETRWFINSEGTQIRTEHPIYSVYASGFTRADDGMLLDRSFNIYAPMESGLPSDAAFLKHVKQLMTDLRALRTAPVMDPYTGPAILAPKATGVFFHEVLGHRLEGHRQDNNEEGQTFAEYTGRKILPPFISVIDDPTRRRFKKIPLNGYYTHDDEGVASRSVTLVERGILRNFLLPRRPVKGFTASNGHGRSQGTNRPVARMGNTLVIAHKTIPASTLKSRLIAEVKRQKKPYGLIIRDITGGATNTSSYGFQAFKGEARMVYRVDPNTGAETLVRGVEIVGTPLVSISKIIAAADNMGVFNGYCGAESGMVPVSTVAPSTLFSEIELQRSARARSKGPILPRPK